MNKKVFKKSRLIFIVAANEELILVMTTVSKSRDSLFTDELQF